MRGNTVEEGVNALRWLIKQAGPEWVQFFATDLFRKSRERGQFGELAKRITADASLRDFARSMRDMVLSA